MFSKYEKCILDLTFCLTPSVSVNSFHISANHHLLLTRVAKMDMSLIYSKTSK